MASAAEVADLLRAEGRSVAVNPAITEHVEVPAEERDRMRISAALDELRR